MTSIAAPLAMLALLNMLASASCAEMPPDPAICYGGRDAPQKAPEQPAGCHAMLSCAEHRRLRTFS
jgi:hypothetical protein